jgi:hypothetical protein
VFHPAVFEKVVFVLFSMEFGKETSYKQMENILMKRHRQRWRKLRRQHHGAAGLQRSARVIEDSPEQAPKNLRSSRKILKHDSLAYPVRRGGPRRTRNALAAGFNAHKGDYMIVGAYALAYHGAPRYTGDMDILVRPDVENARRILDALGEFGFGSLDLNL